jgi:hypothetical protein
VKRFLASRSNIVSAHHFLIAPYVELGRNEEAQAEAAEVMRINPQFSLAVAKPISATREPLRHHLYADYRKAGLK